jgi:hypothetical protein
MPQFYVVVIRTIELVTTVTVSAKNAALAGAQAHRALQGSTVRWQVEDEHVWSAGTDDLRVDQVDEA